MRKQSVLDFLGCGERRDRADSGGQFDEGVAITDENGGRRRRPHTSANPKCCNGKDHVYS